MVCRRLRRFDKRGAEPLLPSDAAEDTAEEDPTPEANFEVCPARPTCFVPAFGCACHGDKLVILGDVIMSCVRACRFKIVGSPSVY